MQCPPGWRPFIDGRPHKLKFNPRDASRVGRAFPMGGVSESGDWILSLEWDMLSKGRSTGNRIPLLARETGCTFPKRANGKLRPTISFQSGTHFPVEGCSGKCIPELILRMGRRFPLRVSAENASRKWALSLDDAPPVPPLLKMRHAVGGNETRGTGHRTYYSWNEQTPLE